MKHSMLIGVTEQWEKIYLDVDTLLRTRLLVQANSGGGKSWLIRRLAEQLFGQVPVIIIDPEGEFSTLREKFGYVLVGKNGETPADLRSAAMVAHKLLELRASAVCDLYELKPQARHQWVRLFLEAMIDAPKNLWGPTVIIVDEAHQFCPEGKAGESEASSAMVDLATRGRKRGFAAVFATQRLGKLRKDAAAELLNVMVGMTFIDIDRERAAECLGVSREEKKEFNDEIKMLTEGHFYCLGRAICKERTLIKVGAISTTHPQVGSGKFDVKPPPPPEEIKKLLPKLADLPRQAEEKLKTEADLKAEIRNLRLELKNQAISNSRVQVETKEVSVLTNADREILIKMGGVASRAQEQFADIVSDYQNAMRKILALPTTGARVQKNSSPLQTRLDTNRLSDDSRSQADSLTVPPSSNGDYNKCERKLLSVLSQFPNGCNRRKLILLAGYAWSGATRNALGHLRSTGAITGENSGMMSITAVGLQAGPFEPLPTGNELVEYWINFREFNKCEREILRCLSQHAHGLNVSQLLISTGYTWSGATRNALGKLRTAEVIVGKNSETIKLSDELWQ